MQEQEQFDEEDEDDEEDLEKNNKLEIKAKGVNSYFRN